MPHFTHEIQKVEFDIFYTWDEILSTKIMTDIKKMYFKVIDFSYNFIL
jgi:hypothetical protein